MVMVIKCVWKLPMKFMIDIRNRIGRRKITFNSRSRLPRKNGMILRDQDTSLNWIENHGQN